MEVSTNTTSAIYDQIFTSNSNSGLLNTPPRPIINEDEAEFRAENDLNNESLSPNDFTNLFKNFSMPPNENILLERTEALLKDVQELKQSHTTIEDTLHRQEQSIIKIKETLCRQDQSNNYIIKMLEQLLPPNTLRNKNTQRLVQPKRKINASESRLMINDRPMSRSNQEVSMNRNRNLMEINQESRRTSSSSEANCIGVEENRNQIGLTTINELNFNGHDEIDKIRSEKNRGKIQIGQWCYEINVGTAEETPVPTTTTDLVSSTIQANTSVLQENQSNRNRTPSPLSSSECQLSRHLTTVNENPLNTSRGGSTEVCFLHPLQGQVSNKTDRHVWLKDCFGNAPVLIVCGDHLPDNTKIEMAMIFTTTKGYYHSLFRLAEKGNDYKDVISRPINICGNTPQKIELRDFKVRRKCNNTHKSEETFVVIRYPSGETEDTMIGRLKHLKEIYGNSQTQLAIRFFENQKSLLNGDVFYSNILSEVLKIQSVDYKLAFSVIRPFESQISFDYNNQCQVKLLTKIPEPFHCTLLSGYKWFEISIITNDILNTYYSIELGNGKTKNPNYFNIKKPSFKISFKIIKQTFLESQSERQTSSLLSINGSNRFCVKIRLLHSEGVPNEFAIDYKNCASWKSKEFTEVKNIGRKRMNEEDCDNSQRLPTSKTLRISENLLSTILIDQ